MSDSPEKYLTSLVRAENQEVIIGNKSLIKRGLDHLFKRDSRRINFPKNCSIGTLYIVDSSGEFWWENERIEYGAATGVVHIPSGKKVILEVQEREEVEEVWAGNCYDYDVESYTYLLPLADLNPNDLQGVDLSCVSVSSLSRGESWASVEYLHNLTGLEWVSMRGNKIGDEDLVFLSGMPSLQYLDLSETEVCGSALYNLKNSKLRELSLNTTNVSDVNGLGFLHHLPYLEKLGLGGNQVTYNCLYDLSTLTNLTELVLDFIHWDEFEIKELDDALPRDCEIIRW